MPSISALKACYQHCRGQSPALLQLLLVAREGMSSELSLELGMLTGARTWRRMILPPSNSPAALKCHF